MVGGAVGLVVGAVAARKTVRRRGSRWERRFAALAPVASIDSNS